MHSDNNLFQFATKELSQDAILAWTINGINGKDESLKALGKTLLKVMIGWEGDIDFSDVVVLRQVKNMDILISFMHDGLQHLVIVEDKVGTGIHDNQLVRYIEEVLDIREVGELPLRTDPYDLYGKELPSLTIEKNCIIHLAFVKTGLLTDMDKFTIRAAETECQEKEYDKSGVRKIQTLDVDTLKKIYDKDTYRSNPIVKMFTEHLDSLCRNDVEINRTIERSICDNGNDWRSLLTTEKGQWYLMKRLTPIEECHRTFHYFRERNEITDIIAAQYNGSSSGTPWTQTSIWAEPISTKKSDDGNGPFYRCIFWRLDYNRISLRYYVGYKSKASLKSQKALGTKDIQNIKEARTIIRNICDHSDMIRDKKPIRVISDDEVGEEMENTLVTIYLTEMKHPRIPEDQLLSLKETMECVRLIHEEFISTFNIELAGNDYPAIAFRR